MRRPQGRSESDVAICFFEEVGRGKVRHLIALIKEFTASYTACLC
jgi:hypothetical protein